MKTTSSMLGSLLLVLALFLASCASVPMASAEQDAASKTFATPGPGEAGLYVYRDTFVGQALKKTVSLDGVPIGETANKVYLHLRIAVGEHRLSTESEFSDNDLTFTAEAGKNYFFEQYIKFGVFVGGANLRAVSEAEGKQAVLRCRQALGFERAPAAEVGLVPGP